MQPEFGSTLTDILFNQGPDVENQIDEAIREAVSNWLPYIIINEINMFQENNQVELIIQAGLLTLNLVFINVKRMGK